MVIYKCSIVYHHTAQGFEDEQRKLLVFFLSCADKGTRTSCNASDDLSSVGSDVLRCYATMVMGWVHQHMQAWQMHSTHSHNLRLHAHPSPSRSPLGFSERSSPRLYSPGRCLRQSISVYFRSADRSSSLGGTTLIVRRLYLQSLQTSLEVHLVSFRCCGLAKQTSLFCSHLNRNAEKSGSWQVFHLLDNSNPIADKLCLKFSDLVTDTDAEPQPVVSGYIEFPGKLWRLAR